MIRKTRSASFLDAPPPRQATERELGDTRTSGNGREHRDRKAPKITVNSAPGKPLNIDMQPIDAVRLMSAFGTAEPGFAAGCRSLLRTTIWACCAPSRGCRRAICCPARARRTPVCSKLRAHCQWQ